MTEFFQYLASGLVIGCIYGLIAVGYTAVYNVTGIVNFAQGDASMLGALSTVGLLGWAYPSYWRSARRSWSWVSCSLQSSAQRSARPATA